MVDARETQGVTAAGPNTPQAKANDQGLAGPAAPFPRGQPAPQQPVQQPVEQPGQGAPAQGEPQGPGEAQPMASPTDLTPDEMALVWDMVMDENEPSVPEIFIDRLNRIRMQDSPFDDWFDKYDDGY